MDPFRIKYSPFSHYSHLRRSNKPLRHSRKSERERERDEACSSNSQQNELFKAEYRHTQSQGSPHLDSPTLNVSSLWGPQEPTDPARGIQNTHLHQQVAMAMGIFPMRHKPPPPITFRHQQRASTHVTFYNSRSGLYSGHWFILYLLLWSLSA